MKLKIRKSEERGKTKLPWLDSKHGFSFGGYSNPENVNFGKLVVLNDDIIAPGKGFGTHPHDNMEIITLVLEGSLKHEDSMKNKGIINSKEIQRMSAGEGVWHSEFNASDKEPLHLLQIWIEPEELNTVPSYEQNPLSLKDNQLNLVASNSKSRESVYINQDASFFLGNFSKDTKIAHIPEKRNVYLFIIKGSISLENNLLSQGDSVEITEAKSLEIHANEHSTILLIELPD